MPREPWTPSWVEAAGGFALLHALVQRAAALSSTFRASTISPATTSFSAPFLANKLTSSLHAGTVAGLAACALLGPQSPYHADVLRPASPALRAAFHCHLGFTLYDLAYMAGQGVGDGSVWLHHVLGLAGTGAMIALPAPWTRYLAYWPGMFAMSEVTTLPANVLAVLRRFGEPGSSRHEWWRRAATWARLLAFLVARTFIGPLCLWRTWRCLMCPDAPSSSSPASSPVPERCAVADVDTPGTPTRQQLPFRARLRHLRQRLRAHAIPPVLFALTLGNVLLFTGLNTYWTALLLRSMWGERAPALRLHHLG
jgi:hypothetical protein